MHQGWLSNLQQFALDTIINQVNDFAGSNLPQLNLFYAMQFLITQMGTDSQTVLNNVVSATATAGGSNVGDGVMAISVLGPTGLSLQNLFAETLTATVTNDSQSGTAAGSKPLSIVGVAGEANPLMYDFLTGGSGSQSQITAIDATVSQSRNLLNNSN